MNATYENKQNSKSNNLTGSYTESNHECVSLQKPHFGRVWTRTAHLSHSVDKMALVSKQADPNLCASPIFESEQLRVTTASFLYLVSFELPALPTVQQALS
jgi:hypothetical protein